MSATFIEAMSVIWDEAAEPFITVPINPVGSIQPGDDLFLLTYNGLLADPDWTILGDGTFEDDGLAAVGYSALYHKKAVGDEGATSLNVTYAGIGLAYAGRVYQFRGTNTQIEDTAVNDTGNGGATIQWNALDVDGGDRTLIAFACQATSSTIGTPTGYTAASGGESTIDSGPIAFAMDCNYLLNQSSGPAVTTSGGPTNGWITIHTALFTPAGRSFIVN